MQQPQRNHPAWPKEGRGDFALAHYTGLTFYLLFKGLKPRQASPATDMLNVALSALAIVRHRMHMAIPSGVPRDVAPV